MDDALYLYGIGGLAVVFGAWIAYTVIAQGNAWRTAVLAIAKKHRLTYVAPEGAISKKFDLAHGRDRGIDVSLCTHSVSRGDNDALYAKIEASGAPAGLVLIKPGTFDSGGVTDFSKASKGPETIGIADFDHSVEVRGANKRVLEALRSDAMLRAQITTLLPRGLVVGDGRVAVISKFPKSAAVIEDRYDRVIDLARKLAELA